jgi:anti-sigma factor RsiW
MSLRRGALDTEALQARVDGLLPPERMAAVEVYLAEHPEERERWSDYAAHCARR